MFKDIRCIEILNKLFDQSIAGIIVWDKTDFKLIYVNTAAKVAFGLDPSIDVTGENMFDYIDETTRKRMQDRIEKYLDKGVPAPPDTQKHTTLDGQEVYIMTSASPVEGDIIISLFQNVTEIHKTKENMARLMENLETPVALHEMVYDSAGVARDFLYREVNPAFEREFNLTKEEVRDRSVLEILPEIKTDRFNWVKFYGDMVRNKGKASFEEESEGLGKWFKIKAYHVNDNQFIASFADITESKELEKDLKDLAMTDPLTTIHNRRGGMLLLDNVFEMSKREKIPLSVIYIDIDNFKSTNDELGHRAGDDLLVSLSEHLKKFVRGSDIIFRIGGDEFVVGLLKTSFKEASKFCDRLKVKLKKEEIEVSCGIYEVSPEDNIDDIINKADIMMYREKG